MASIGVYQLINQPARVYVYVCACVFYVYDLYGLNNPNLKSRTPPSECVRYFPVFPFSFFPLFSPFPLLFFFSLWFLPLRPAGVGLVYFAPGANPAPLSNNNKSVYCVDVDNVTGPSRRLVGNSARFLFPVLFFFPSLLASPPFFFLFFPFFCFFFVFFFYETRSLISDSA